MNSPSGGPLNRRRPKGGNWLDRAFAPVARSADERADETSRSDVALALPRTRSTVASRARRAFGAGSIALTHARRSSSIRVDASPRARYRSRPHHVVPPVDDDARPGPDGAPCGAPRVGGRHGHARHLQGDVRLDDQAPARRHQGQTAQPRHLVRLRARRPRDPDRVRCLRRDAIASTFDPIRRSIAPVLDPSPVVSDSSSALPPLSRRYGSGSGQQSVTGFPRRTTPTRTGR